MSSTRTFDPNKPGELFEPVGPAPFDETKIGNRVECKACARTAASTQPAMRRHANQPKKLSNGSTGTCAEFWFPPTQEQEAGSGD